MFSLAGKRALITGGTAGIGLATAHRFAAAGAQVAVVGRRDATEIAALFGGLAIQADVTDDAQLLQAFEQAAKQLGLLDIVMNNAGIENTGPTIEEQDAAEFQRLIDIDLKPVYNGLRFAPRHMNDGGAIINTSSVAVQVGLPGYAQYAAAKAAVLTLSRNAALELVDRNIRVNAICPGSIWSEMLPKNHPEVAIVEALCPMARIGEPEEVAALCHFLAAPDCSYITGQAIVIDGGIDAGFSMRTLEALVS